MLPTKYMQRFLDSVWKYFVTFAQNPIFTWTDDILHNNIFTLYFIYVIITTVCRSMGERGITVSTLCDVSKLQK